MNRWLLFIEGVVIGSSWTIVILELGFGVDL